MMEGERVEDREIPLLNSVTFKEEEKYWASVFPRGEKEFKKSFLFVFQIHT